MENDMENTEFKKGQIVYMGDSDGKWILTHYAGRGDLSGGYKASHDYNLAIIGRMSSGVWPKCLSVEDYHKMLSQPKDKNLVFAWDVGDEFSRDVRFYDAINYCVFNYDGCRNGSSYDNYEVMPKDQWPEWAVEAYELLED